MRMWITAGMCMLALTVAVQAQDFGDTPYVQTPQNVVDAMLKTAKVTARDYVIDLGSGDGRMVITAAKQFGARGFGVDLDKRLVQLANNNAGKAGVADRAKFYARDLFETDLSPASVITIYLLPEVNLMARSKLLALAPGTRIVSHDYGIGDWLPDLEYEMDAPGKPVGRSQKSKVLFWVVPDVVAGRWVWQVDGGGKPRSVELTLKQNYQKLEATAKLDDRALPVEQATLTGRVVEVTLMLPERGRVTFRGQRINQVLEGEMRAADDKNAGKGKPVPWNAVRVEIMDAAHVIAPPPVIREFGTDPNK
ncbi:MAG: class I SAM-dependent methyltransferase [Burkholderiales bacterium]|nr:class I SAM-dependent methyltransferase [Burkholderiales bacterium]